MKPVFQTRANVDQQLALGAALVTANMALNYGDWRWN